MEAPDFFVENLLDLPNGDDLMNDAFFATNNITTNNSTDSSNANGAVDSCNSSISGADNVYPAGGDYDARCFPDPSQFSGELCVPYDAELEWLSNFVEESFSSEDLHKLHFIPAPNSNNLPTHNQQQYHPHQTDATRQQNPIFTPVTLVPGKARSKLSRVAPSDWSTRLLMVTPPPPPTATTTSSSDTTFPHHLHNPKKSASKRRDASVSADTGNGEMRRCLHCAAEKTPQWRTGPMGPKTLCNACGVRYKSGRLVPEYRPAASPTFVSTKHSNSHRKVMELRRQKDMHRHVGGHPQQMMTAPAGVFGLGGGSNGGADDYLIHHHVGPDYRQLI